MIYLIAAIALLVGLICCILFLNTKIIIEYDKKNLKVSIRNPVFRLTLDQKRFRGRNKKTEKAKDGGNTDSVPEEEETAESFFERVEDIKKQYRELGNTADVFIKCIKYRARISGILLRVTYGTGDAAATGMLYGACWALVGNLYSFLCRFLYVEFPDLELKPEYGKKIFELHAEGIITVRLVHIINAALRAYAAYRSSKKKQK